MRFICSLHAVEIEDGLSLAHDWLRSQPWWSDDADAICSVERIDRTWVVHHSARKWVETGDPGAVMIGGYGPVVVTDDGQIIPAEPGCTAPPGGGVRIRDWLSEHRKTSQT